MHFEVSDKSDVEKKALITIPRQKLDDEIKLRLKSLQKDLTIKGFRKGKVPTDIIRARYYDSLKNEAVNELVQESFWKILQEKSWFPASRAEIKELNENDDITVALHFEIIPEFAVEQYKEIELYREKSLPDEVLLEKALAQLKEQYAKTQAISRPSAVDDIVTMDIMIAEGATTKQRNTDVVMKIGDRSFPDEVNRVLVGSRVNEKKQVDVKELTYHLAIKKIEERILPTIDDAFAREHQLRDLEELRQKLLEDARAADKKRQEEELKERLSQILLERTQFATPKSMATVEYQKIIQRMNLEDNDSNRERFWDIAEKRTRLNLILDWIARKENITVSDQDIEKLTETMGIKVTKENKPDIQNYIKTMLIREKTLHFVYENAKISEKSRIISPKEVQNDTDSLRH